MSSYSITLGQYYNTKSIIHDLDPRTKIIGTFIYMISLFVTGNIFCYLIAALFLLSLIKLSCVPFKYMMRGLRPIIVILLMTIFFNLILTPGETIISFWIIRITKQGFMIAFRMAFRLILLILGSSLMTYTTSPNELTDGLEKILSPFKLIGVPAHEIAMMMSIALRFIPILSEETDKIIKAQKARGADFESGNIIQRARALVPILVPLFVSAFKRASDLAYAMEARGYRGGVGRTRMHPLKYKRRDFIAYVVLVLYLILIIIIGHIL